MLYAILRELDPATSLHMFFSRQTDTLVLLTEAIAKKIACTGTEYLYGPHEIRPPIRNICRAIDDMNILRSLFYACTGNMDPGFKDLDPAMAISDLRALGLLA